MTETKLIKRYQNRKLYDPEDSNYVTLEKLDHWIKSGRDVKVICNKTKNDITASTLTQLMYEKERAGKTLPSAELLKEIIRHGDGSFTGYIQAQLASEMGRFDGTRVRPPVMNQ